LLKRAAPPSHTDTDEHRTVGILHITKTRIVRSPMGDTCPHV
jgi:hypothetical protein